VSPHRGAARQVLVQGFAGTMGAAYVQYNLLDGVQVGLMQLRASWPHAASCLYCCRLAQPPPVLLMPV